MIYHKRAARKVGSDTDIVATVGMSLLIIVKFFTWQGLLATSPEGSVALSLFWRRAKLFLPIWGEPRNLTQEVSRVWIRFWAGVS